MLMEAASTVPPPVKVISNPYAGDDTCKLATSKKYFSPGGKVLPWIWPGLFLR